MKQTKNQQPPAVVPKNVKHTFTEGERAKLGYDLSAEFCKAQTLEKEFDEVKAQHKAKLAECDARISSISNAVRAGFEMRVEDVILEYRPKDRQKDYFAIVRQSGEDGDITKGDLLLTEPMTQDDFQQDLLNAEAAFEARKSIDLFPSTATDYGCIIIGRLKNKWYAAVRVKIGDKLSLEEPMNADQKAFGERYAAVEFAGKRAMKWFKEKMDKDAAKGFEGPVRTAVESQKEIAE